MTLQPPVLLPHAPVPEPPAAGQASRWSSQAAAPLPSFSSSSPPISHLPLSLLFFREPWSSSPPPPRSSSRPPPSCRSSLARSSLSLPRSATQRIPARRKPPLLRRPGPRSTPAAAATLGIEQIPRPAPPLPVDSIEPIPAADLAPVGLLQPLAQLRQPAHSPVGPRPADNERGVYHEEDNESEDEMHLS